MRIRRNVYSLPPGDQTLHWYAVGVETMKSRNPNDPRSWKYQGAVHGIPATPPPSKAAFWDQCQHGNYFFLPWHRMYLLRFERIVAAEIAAQGGPADWALPYWNYSKPGQTLLPPDFRSPTTSTGAPNPLYVAQRVPAANAGSPFLSPKDTSINNCLTAPGTAVPAGFFGLATGPAHFSGGAGALELTPHNTIHVAIGGWMSDPDQAALDPVFWLHHSNIDRLWEVWLSRDPAHVNLTAPYWRNGVSFNFHNETGAVMPMRTADVLNLSAPTVDYSYDDTSDPLPPPAAPPVLAAAGAALESVQPPAPPMVTTPQMELAGATQEPVQLGSQVRHVQLPTPVTQEAFLAASAPASTSGLESVAQAKVQQVTLVLENVTSTDLAPTYDVYLNVPDTAEPGDREDRFIGRAALFGIAKASDPNGQHGGGGQTVAFDVTELYQQLAKTNELNQNSLQVSFVPVNPGSHPHVSVGRISLYFA